MRVRLAAMMTAAMLLLPVASASASYSKSPQPEKKCPSLSFILHHCD
jgi:hypothetical protein